MDPVPTDTPLGPWPFPQWNGERWVMPMDHAPSGWRTAKQPKGPDLSDIEEALF